MVIEMMDRVREGLSEEEFNKLREEFDSRLDAYMKEWEASLREAMERG
jgi:hypothetical protein